MKKFIVTSLFILIISMVCLFLNSFWDKNSFSTKRKLVYKISEKLADQYRDKYGLYYMGISEAAPEGRYSTIGFILRSHKVLTKDEGRILLLNCANDALIELNSSDELTQYLMDYPFTNKNNEISIIVQPPDFDVFYPDIVAFTLCNNILCYRTDSPENKFQYYSTQEESYDEAIAIIDKS